MLTSHKGDRFATSHNKSPGAIRLTCFNTYKCSQIPAKEVFILTRGKGSSTKGASSSKGHYRSAISGRYVKASYGKSHSKTTVKESK
jgi:hypothetical protein